jgi:hypothetical protein
MTGIHLPTYAVTWEKNLKIIIILLPSLMMEMIKLSGIRKMLMLIMKKIVLPTMRK